MSTRMRRMGALVGGAAVLSFGAYAIGSQAGGGVAESGKGAGVSAPSTSVAYGAGPSTHVVYERRGPGMRGLQQLADRLGVKPADLEKALEDIRKSRSGSMRDDFAAGLAKKLGLDEAKVREALDNVMPRPPKPPAGLKDDLAAGLAKELGLSEDKVRAALDKVHPSGPADRDEFVTALAKELGVSRDKLEAAFRKVHPRPPGPPPGLPGPPPGVPGPPPPGARGAGPVGPDTAALAKALGIDEADLKKALEELRAEHQAAEEKRRNEFAQALADRLGIDVDKVKDALPAGPPHHGRRGP